MFEDRAILIPGVYGADEFRTGFSFAGFCDPTTDVWRISPLTVVEGLILSISKNDFETGRSFVVDTTVFCEYMLNSVIDTALQITVDAVREIQRRATLAIRYVKTKVKAVTMKYRHNPICLRL